MRRKLKLPTNLSAEHKQFLKRATQMYTRLGELEMFMSAAHKILESDQSEKACKLRIEIKASLARISENRNGLGEGLTAFGMLPQNPKPARRAASTKVK